MKITKKLKGELEKYLPDNYRKVIVDRLATKGVKVHANTVSNVLNGNENTTVALEILKLSNEGKAEHEKQHKEIDKNLKQLSAA